MCQYNIKQYNNQFIASSSIIEQMLLGGSNMDIYGTGTDIGCELENSELA